MTEEQVKVDAITRIEGWEKEFNIKNTSDDVLPLEIEEMFDFTINLLNEMIEYCLLHQFRPVLVVPPTSSVLNDLMSKQFIKKVLYNNIEKANKQKNTGLGLFIR